MRKTKLMVGCCLALVTVLAGCATAEAPTPLRAAAIAPLAGAAPASAHEVGEVPEGDLIRIMERAGPAFRPATQPFTSFEQTVSMIDLLRADVSRADTALFLMREGAVEATFSTTAIDRELGNVLSDKRTRAAPAYRMALGEIGYFFEGDLLGGGFSIGLMDIIRTTPRERSVELFEGYYRSERPTLIIVGDFDIDELEGGMWASRS